MCQDKSLEAVDMTSCTVVWKESRLWPAQEVFDSVAYSHKEHFYQVAAEYKSLYSSLDQICLHFVEGFLPLHSPCSISLFPLSLFLYLCWTNQQICTLIVVTNRVSNLINYWKCSFADVFCYCM